ncbi:MAG: Crp/Fnr family transcriptional regulator [Gammaproteobacteria bacterium]|nr:Crp/Fnr family transcriptional regulator [Gammaproteobacteria bacterium]MDH4253189.1 Crp/Fnr family transcriptional regulator [Gammaproteobacteria bacterium]MDH5308449.1 Crp/Fnr family transcriptional regulator [Gammaproteobacteria bacterium]
MDTRASRGDFDDVEPDLRPAHHVLSNYGFYTRAERSIRTELLEAAQPVRPEPGATLLEAGRPCGEVLLIGSGSMRVYVAGDSGREVTLYHVRSGETCPANLSAAMLSLYAFASAAATEGLQAAYVPAAGFRRLSKKSAEIRDYMFTSTASRFGEVIGRVRELTTRRVDHRLAEYLLRKFAESGQTRPILKVTHQAIAIELGTAREVVSRRLQELEAAAVVSLGRGRVTLLDERKLRAIL